MVEEAETVLENEEHNVQQAATAKRAASLTRVDGEVYQTGRDVIITLIGSGQNFNCESSCSKGKVMTALVACTGFQAYYDVETMQRVHNGFELAQILEIYLLTFGQ
jgi:hypothetical protein